MYRSIRLPHLAAAMGLVVGLASSAGAQTVRYVRADAPVGGNGLSWETAHRRVQDAVNSSAAGDSIWVAAGTYRAANAGTMIELRNAVATYGGFTGTETSLDQRNPVANTTIISGDVLGDDDIGGSINENAAPIFNAQNNVLATTIVDGFTIRSSGANAQGTALRSLGSPTFRNCIFTRNTPGAGGAVAHLSSVGPSVSPRLINCRFVLNGTNFLSTQGICVIDSFSVDARIVNCQFIANTTFGAPIISHRNGAVTIVNTSVISNLMVTSDPAVLAGFSGGGSQFTLINSTIAGNRCNSGPTAGLRANIPSVFLVRNCILWGNEAGSLMDERAQVQVSAFGSRLDYCRVQGWLGQIQGTATSSANPMLTDLNGPDDLFGTGDEDVRLLPGSSAIDAANNFYVWPDIADLDNDGDTAEPTPFALGGALRFIDDPATADTGLGTPPLADIGAFEFGTPAAPCRADYNTDGVVNSQDFFDFLAEFFVGCP